MNLEVEDGLVYFKFKGIRIVAIPDVAVKGQGVQKLMIRQGHLILTHLEAERTAVY